VGHLTRRCSEPAHHKVLGRGRLSFSVIRAPARPRASATCPVAELGSYAPRVTAVLRSLGLLLLIGTLHAAEPTPVLLHTFVAGDVPIGYLYGFREPNTSDAYSRLEVRSTTSTTPRVLYRVERTALYLGSGEVDATIHDDGSRGFIVTAIRPQYVTIECCRLRTANNGAMDSITIEWDPEGKRFAQLKTP